MSAFLLSGPQGLVLVAESDSSLEKAEKFVYDGTHLRVPSVHREISDTLHISRSEKAIGTLQFTIELLLLYTTVA